MKILSWDENPHIRNKDASDLFFIMRHYIEAGNLDRLYQESSDLFNDTRSADYDMISARFLGRSMAAILKESNGIKLNVVHILKREMGNDTAKGLIQTIMMARSFPQYDYQRIAKLISALCQGLNDS